MLSVRRLRFLHKFFQFVQIQPTFVIFHCFSSFLQLQQKLFLGTITLVIFNIHFFCYSNFSPQAESMINVLIKPPRKAPATAAAFASP